MVQDPPCRQSWRLSLPLRSYLASFPCQALKAWSPQVAPASYLQRCLAPLSSSTSTCPLELLPTVHLHQFLSGSDKCSMSLIDWGKMAQFCTDMQRRGLWILSSCQESLFHFYDSALRSLTSSRPLQLGFPSEFQGSMQQVFSSPAFWPCASYFISGILCLYFWKPGTNIFHWCQDLGKKKSIKCWLILSVE